MWRNKAQDYGSEVDHPYEEINQVRPQTNGSDYITPIYNNDTKPRTKLKQYRNFLDRKTLFNTKYLENDVQSSDDERSSYDQSHQTFLKTPVNEIERLDIPDCLPSGQLDHNQNIKSDVPRYTEIPNCGALTSRITNPPPCCLHRIHENFPTIHVTIDTSASTENLSNDLQPNVHPVEQTETRNETENHQNGEIIGTNNPKQSSERKTCSCLTVIAVSSLVGNVLFTTMFIYIIISLNGPTPDQTPVPTHDPETPFIIDDETFKRSVCFSLGAGGFLDSCHGDEDVFSLKVNGNDELCCMKNAEHIQWLIKIAKIRRFSLRNLQTNRGGYLVDSANVAISIDKKEKRNSALVLNNGSQNFYESGSVKVARDGIRIEQDGYYAVYLFLKLNPSGQQHITAKLLQENQLLFNKEQKMIARNSNISMLNVLKLNAGVKLTPWLSDPKFLYNWEFVNYMGVVKLSK